MTNQKRALKTIDQSEDRTHLRVNVLYSCLHIIDTGSCHRYGASGEYLQGRLGVLDLVGDTWVKLGLVGGLLEGLREGDNLDGEGEGAGAKHIDNSPILDPDVLVFIIQLLKNSRELPRTDSGLFLTVSSCTCDLPTTPDRCSCVRMSKVDI